MRNGGVFLQYLLPKRLLTAIAGRVAGRETGWGRERLIRWFVAKYGVDMAEAAEPDTARYTSFNAFFTRELRPGLRPIADADFVSPVDGTISQLGPIDDVHILQAKGHRFTVTDLLGGDAELASKFRHGSFANLYLSPRDYHRIHMPCAGRLTRMIHVPGSLFSVNPATARGVPNLFARNERVICVFETETFGSFVMVLVGATIVGSMATAWHGVVRSQTSGEPSRWDYDGETIKLDKGEEMGRFLLGSTVIMLFEEEVIDFKRDWQPERLVRLGESMGALVM
ncbi:archaetidylserine decarboxylase [Qipengyuania sp.]|uniref:archaetidylserine decarboxylase n=1 Tax=Qipengyuania sp. TaxID=2004515 RepID=UPI0035C820BA